jgi:uncharacterized membrane protein
MIDQSSSNSYSGGYGHFGGMSGGLFGISNFILPIILIAVIIVIIFYYRRKVKNLIKENTELTMRIAG